MVGGSCPEAAGAAASAARKISILRGGKYKGGGDEEGENRKQIEANKVIPSYSDQTVQRKKM